MMRTSVSISMVSLRSSVERATCVFCHCGPKNFYQLNSSLCLDAGIADGAGVIVMFLAQKSPEWRAASGVWVETLNDEFGAYFLRRHRGGEPAGKLIKRFFRRLCRCHDPKPDVHLEVRVTSFR